MQVEIFNPTRIYAAATENGCYLSGHEAGRAGGFGLHFDDADALGAFGLAVVEEARRLLREQEEKTDAYNDEFAASFKTDVTPEESP